MATRQRFQRLAPLQSPVARALQFIPPLFHSLAVGRRQSPRPMGALAQQARRIFFLRVCYLYKTPLIGDLLLQFLKAAVSMILSFKRRVLGKGEQLFLLLLLQ